MSNATFDDVWAEIGEVVERRPEGTHVSVTLRDLSTGETRDLDGERDFPSASTIKTLIAVGLTRAIDAGEKSFDDKLDAPADIRLDGSGVVNWLDATLQLSLRDHAWLMIAISDNTTSNVLIDAVGVDAINAAGQELGAGGTRLGRKFIGSNQPMPPGPAKNRATSNGLVNIMTAIEDGTAASTEMCAWLRKIHADQQHVDRIPRRLPDGVTYRGKTGTIEEIAHDCGVLEGEDGTRVVLAILTQGFSDAYDADALIGSIGALAARLVGANE